LSANKRVVDADDEPGSIRLDKWLWAARLYRTRAAAAEAIELGRVRVNEHKVKPAKAVRIDDRIAMRIGAIDREVVVVALSEVRVAAPLAQARYAETETSVAAREAAESRRRLQREPALSRHGRPTKRERRQLDTVTLSPDDVAGVTPFVDSGRDPDGF